MQHLNSDLIPRLADGKDKRIADLAIMPVVGYPAAKQAMDRMDDLLVHPRMHRMPNLLLAGSTNNGKTVVADKFVKRHPAFSIEGEDFIHVPVVMVQAPPVPDEKRFYNGILERLCTPYKLNDKIDRKQNQVLRLLAEVRTKLLIIDEIHHILAGNLSKQRGFLNVIKYLSNELQIPIVAIGTKDAFRAIHSDPQLANRFEPYILPRWRDSDEYRRLLVSFEYHIPLKKPSGLASDELSQKILSMSEGSLGEIVSILKQASIEAIRTGEECITRKSLDRLQWLTPTQRKSEVNKL